MLRNVFTNQRHYKQFSLFSTSEFLRCAIAIKSDKFVNLEDVSSSWASVCSEEENPITEQDAREEQTFSSLAFPSISKSCDNSEPMTEGTPPEQDAWEKETSSSGAGR